MNALLRFDEVSLSRGGRVLFEALSFALEPGAALHVSGPNGTGKSSLIRLAAGLLRQSQGHIDRAPLALADDQLALDRELPLGSALEFWGGEVEQALNRLGITRLRDVPVRFLSSGQLKRASLARVLASKAPLWLLDEPLNALDAEAIDCVAMLLAEHRAEGGAVLVASHQPLAGDWQVLSLRP